MNIIFVFQVQDGEQQRFEFQTEELEGDIIPTEAIDARGEEINRERFTGEELYNGFYWDSSMQTASSYYKYIELPHTDSYKLIQGILD